MNDWDVKGKKGDNGVPFPKNSFSSLTNSSHLNSLLPPFFLHNPRVYPPLYYPGSENKSSRLVVFWTAMRMRGMYKSSKWGG